MKFGLSKKIWLCMGILMLGYAVSVTRSLVAEREVSARLTSIRMGLLPAKQGSQSVLDSFNLLRSEYLDAVTFGERERLESAKEIIRDITDGLSRMKDNNHLASSVRQSASSFLDRAQAYDQKASSTYERLLDVGVDDAGIPLETLKALIVESQAIASDLNQWNTDQKQVLSENLTMISTRMQRETTLNMIILGGVTLLSGSIAFVIISKKIVGPINDTVRLAREISDGNYENRLAVKGEDEMSDLGRAFNRMTEKLESTLLGLQEEVKVRRAAEDELKKLNEEDPAIANKVLMVIATLLSLSLRDTNNRFTEKLLSIC